MSKESHVFTGVFIPAKIWLNPNISPVKKMILGEVKALSEDSGWCFASNSHFSKWLGCTPQNVSIYLSQLEKSGQLQMFFTDKKTGAGRKMRVNAEWYNGLSPAVPPLSPAVPPLSPAVPPLSPAVTEIQFKDTFKPIERAAIEKNSLPAVENSFPLEAVGNVEGENLTGGGVRAEIHDPELPRTTVLDIVPPAPVTEPPQRIELGDRPSAETPVELQTELRRFYSDWPNEWSIGILDYGRGQRYSVEQRGEIVKDFCCWAVKNNQQRDTYRQLNAALQNWFRNEQHSTWKQPKPGQNVNGEKPIYQRPKNAIY